MNEATVSYSLFHNFLKALPGVPALLAPTEKLCIGAAPKDRLRARPEPELDWYWKLAEVFSGEEGTLRGGRGSVMRVNIISIMDWRSRQLSYNLAEWIFFPLMEFEAEKNTVQAQVQATGLSLQTKTFSSDN